MTVWLFQWLLSISVLLPAAPSAFSNAHVHPFYVSVVEVNHNKKEATLEISCKLFAEDAVTTLNQQYKTQVDIAQQKATIDGLLADYIPKHLSLQADKRAQKLRYIGYEVEAESLYCYFEVDGVPAVKTIDLHNSLLYDLTDQQINIMHVMVDGVRKSSKLDYPNTEASFAF